MITTPTTGKPTPKGPKRFGRVRLVLVLATACAVGGFAVLASGVSSSSSRPAPGTCAELACASTSAGVWRLLPCIRPKAGRR